MRFPASVDLIYALCCFSQDLNDPTLQLRQSVRCISYAFEECSTYCVFEDSNEYDGDERQLGGEEGIRGASYFCRKQKRFVSATE